MPTLMIQLTMNTACDASCGKCRLKPQFGDSERCRLFYSKLEFIRVGFNQGYQRCQQCIDAEFIASYDKVKSLHE